MSSPLVGAWEFDEDTPDGWRGIWILTEKHYVHFYEQKNRKRDFQGSQLTEADEAYGYRTIGGGGGPYTVSDNIFTLSEELDRLLDGHRPVRWQFIVEGDRLILIDPEDGYRATYKKIS